MFCKTEQADGCAVLHCVLTLCPFKRRTSKGFSRPVEMLIFTQKHDTNCDVVGYSQDANTVVSSDNLSLMCLIVCDVHRHTELQYSI